MTGLTPNTSVQRIAYTLRVPATRCLFSWEIKQRATGERVALGFRIPNYAGQEDSGRKDESGAEPFAWTQSFYTGSQ